MIRTRRIYEAPATEDGYRILVDRLWPRGIKKENARVDLWLKEVAPSNELRKWLHGGQGSWEEFAQRYKAELSEKEDLLKQLKALETEHGTITLLFAKKDERQNNAVALKAILENF